MIRIVHRNEINTLIPFDIRYDVMDNFFYKRLGEILKDHHDHTLSYLVDFLPILCLNMDPCQQNGILIEKNGRIIFSILRNRYDDEENYIMISKIEKNTKSRLFMLLFSFGILVILKCYRQSN
jgi:hypothetical protein